MKRPVSILFDIGGTLLREERYNLAAGVVALLDDFTIRTVHSSKDGPRVSTELIQEISRTHEHKWAEFRFVDWLRAQLETSSGQPTPDVQEIELRLWPKIVSLKPIAGVHEAIGELQQSGIGLGAVSNAIHTGITLEAELAKHGLASAFQFVISSADQGVRKPAPAIFREAISRIGADPSELWFVGDSWEADIIGAARVGMYPIWLSVDHSDAGHIPHRRIQGWNEFLDLYRSIT